MDPGLQRASLIQVEEGIKTCVKWSATLREYVDGCFESENAVFSNTAVAAPSTLDGRLLRRINDALALTPVANKTRRLDPRNTAFSIPSGTGITSLRLFSPQTAAFATEIRLDPLTISQGQNPMHASSFDFDRAEMIMLSPSSMNLLSTGPVSASLIDRGAKRIVIYGGKHETSFVYTFQASMPDSRSGNTHVCKVGPGEDTPSDLQHVSLEFLGFGETEPDERSCRYKARYFVDQTRFWEQAA